MRPAGQLPRRARRGAAVRPVDPRLLRHARAARGYLIFAVGLGLAGTALILAQAGLLAHALTAAARGSAAARRSAGTVPASSASHARSGHVNRE
jgi:hypothetical protein